jgi:hypothetical protein
MYPSVPVYPLAWCCPLVSFFWYRLGFCIRLIFLSGATLCSVSIL